MRTTLPVRRKESEARPAAVVSSEAINVDGKGDEIRAERARLDVVVDGSRRREYRMISTDGIGSLDLPALL